MAVLSRFIFGLLASVAIASPTPAQNVEHLVSRAVIASDAVVGFAETVPGEIPSIEKCAECVVWFGTSSKVLR